MEDNDLQILQKILRGFNLDEGIPADWVNRLAKKGAIGFLIHDSSSEAIELLKSVVLESPIPEIAEEALSGLGELAGSHPQAAKTLYELAIINNKADAIQMINDLGLESSNQTDNIVFSFLFGAFNHYLEQDPTGQKISEFFMYEADGSLQTRLENAALRQGWRHWPGIMSSLKIGTGEEFNRVLNSYSTFSEKDQNLFKRGLVAAASQSSQPAVNALCDIVIEFEDHELAEICLQYGYFPDQPTRKALFFYLTGQWDKYREHDFSNTLLGAAYENASTGVRQRLLTMARNSGQIEWMQNIKYIGRLRWMSELSNSDWDSILQSLEIQARWHDLWQLTLAAPAIWARQILIILSRNKWVPESLDEQAIYYKWLQLVNNLTQNPPEIVLKRSLHSPAKDVLSIALSPDESELFCGGSDHNIYIWKLGEKSWIPRQFITSNATCRAIVISPDQTYLVCANGDHKIRIYRRKDFALVKTLEGHEGLIRSLFFDQDGKILFSASFDGSLKAWRFPLGPEIETIQKQEGEIFAAGIMSNGQIVTSGSDQSIHLYTWPGASQIRKIPLKKGTITCVGLGSDGLAAAYTRNGELQLVNLNSARVLAAIKIQEQLTTLLIHPTSKFILALDTQGTLHGYEIPSLQAEIKINKHAGTGIGMLFAKNANQVITASQDGTIGVWTFDYFIAARTPLNVLSRDFFNNLQERMNSQSLPGSIRLWLEFITSIYQWRTRYDIEIGEPRVLSVDEFDIQL